MAYVLQEGAGTMFPNENKNSDKHPDYNGKCMYNGKLHWYSLWKNQSKSGSVYLSTKIGKEVEEKGNSNSGKENISDDIPF